MRKFLGMKKIIMTLVFVSVSVFSNNSQLAVERDEQEHQQHVLQVNEAQKSNYKLVAKGLASAAVGAVCAVADACVTLSGADQNGADQNRLLNGLVYTANNGIEETRPESGETGFTFKKSLIASRLSMLASFDGKEVVVINYGMGARAILIDGDGTGMTLTTNGSRNVLPQNKFLLGSTSSLWRRTTVEECLAIFKEVCASHSNPSDIARRAIEKLIERDPNVLIAVLPLEKITTETKKKKEISKMRTAAVFSAMSATVFGLLQWIKLPSMPISMQ